MSCDLGGDTRKCVDCGEDFPAMQSMTMLIVEGVGPVDRWDSGSGLPEPEVKSPMCPDCYIRRKVTPRGR